MKFLDFLNILNLKDKISFTIFTIKLRLFPPKSNTLAEFRSFLTKLKNLGYNIKIDATSVLLSSGTSQIKLRLKSSDLDVFRQVFIDEEYKAVIDCAKNNNVAVTTIIDAGSNIGLTSLKFLNSFPNAKIFCLEPDQKNFESLKFNLKNHTDHAEFLNKALWNKRQSLYLDFGFRDSREWSIRVSENATTPIAVEGISVNDIIEKYTLKSIDILKIDIEGSEVQIFNEMEDLPFLKIVKIIALEIHDEFNSRQHIYGILKKHKFILFNSGELTIGFKSE